MEGTGKAPIKTYNRQVSVPDDDDVSSLVPLLPIEMTLSGVLQLEETMEVYGTRVLDEHRLPGPGEHRERSPEWGCLRLPSRLTGSDQERAVFS